MNTVTISDGNRGQGGNETSHPFRRWIWKIKPLP